MLWFLLVCVHFNGIVSDKVPVLIWSNDRNLVLPDPLAGHTLTHSDFSRLFLDTIAAEEKINVVVFVQDKVSLDDITLGAAVYENNEDDDVFSQIKSIMSSLSVAELPSVKSPTTAIADLKKHFLPGSVHQLQSPYHVGDLSLDHSDGRHQLIVVQLPDTAPAGLAYQQSLKRIDEIVGSVTSQLKSLSVPFVALYTASRSSLKPTTSATSRHTGRQLLQSANTGSGGSSNSVTQTLMANISEQFFLYADSVLIGVNKSGLFNLSTTQWEVDSSSTECPNNDSTTCTVVLRYYGTTPSDVTDIHMKFVVKKTMYSNAGYWYLSEFEVWYKSNGVEQRASLDPNFVDQTPFNFSYHCQEPPTIISINSSDAAVNITFGNFQIQAFDFKDNKFGYYNDCIGFFTIPIWMGLISSIVMLTILLFGVFMLLDIKTMDRYDDPKGKTITITATD
jgi:V-type H+-transporting ATPase S1 subunit